MQQALPSTEGFLSETLAINSPLSKYKTKATLNFMPAAWNYVLFCFSDECGQNKAMLFKYLWQRERKSEEKNECVCFRWLFFHRHWVRRRAETGDRKRANLVSQFSLSAWLPNLKPIVLLLLHWQALALSHTHTHIQYNDITELSRWVAWNLLRCSVFLVKLPTQREREWVS